MSKIKSTLIAFAAMLAVGAECASGTAAAADRPQIWTGAYGGVNAGYAWGGTSADWAGDRDTPDGAGNAVLNTALKDLVSFAPISRATPLRSDGVIGGGQLGYSVQLGSWVAGIEADIQFSGLEGDFSRSGAGILFGFTFPYTASLQQRLDWFGTVRGRLGYLATDKILIFGTAGLAYGRTEMSGTVTNDAATPIGAIAATLIDCLAPNGAKCLGGSDSRTSTGWTAGAGFEWAWRNNTTFKFEYLHIDLGDQNIRLIPVAPALGTGFARASSSNTFEIVRAAINVRF